MHIKFKSGLEITPKSKISVLSYELSYDQEINYTIWFQKTQYKILFKLNFSNLLIKLKSTRPFRFFFSFCTIIQNTLNILIEKNYL